MVLKILNDWLKRSNKVERLWLLAKIEFKLRYYENKLGLFWALLKPILDIIIYYIVFQIVIKQNMGTIYYQFPFKSQDRIHYMPPWGFEPQFLP